MSPEQGGIPLDPEIVVAGIATGDLDVADPRVVAVLRARPDLAAEVEALRAIQRELDDAAAMEREVLREAGVTTGPRRTVRQRTWGLLLCAAALLVAALLYLPLGGGPSPMLGSARDAHIERTADAALVLRWGGELDRGQYYVVTLRHPDTGTELAHSPALRQPEWNLPTLPLPVPATLAVEIAIRDATPRPISTSRGRVELPR